MIRRKKIGQTYSSNSLFGPSMCLYTTNFKEIHDIGPSFAQLKISYMNGYNIIPKQVYRGQGLGKYEQGIKVPINLPSQASTKALGHPHHSAMDDLLRIQFFKEYLVRHRNYHPSKGASS